MRLEAFAVYRQRFVQTMVRALVDAPGAVEVTPLGGRNKGETGNTVAATG